MTAQFQISSDPFGNLLAVGGWIIQTKTGTALSVGGSSLIEGDQQEAAQGNLWPATQRRGTRFIGGSGRNLVASGTVTSTLVPTGFYVPQFTGIYSNANTPFLLTLGTGQYEIADSTDIIATLAGASPIGSYSSTAYGQTTYNGGAAFSIVVAAESATPNDLPDADVSISAGTAQDGVFSATSETVWTSDASADWTVEIASDGTAQLLYLGDAMAERAAGPTNDPSGLYEANADGKTDFNGGEPWRAFVTLARVVPQAGWVYLEIEDTDGTLTAATGPHFAATLPTPSDPLYSFPIAYCDGANAPEQVHSGTVLWP
jgi:hypothetical protein